MTLKIPERCKQCKYFSIVHLGNRAATSTYFFDASMNPTDVCCKDVYDMHGLNSWESWMQKCDMFDWFEWNDKLTKYDFEEDCER